MATVCGPCSAIELELVRNVDGYLGAAEKQIRKGSVPFCSGAAQSISKAALSANETQSPFFCEPPLTGVTPGAREGLTMYDAWLIAASTR